LPDQEAQFFKQQEYSQQCDQESQLLKCKLDDLSRKRESNRSRDLLNQDLSKELLLQMLTKDWVEMYDSRILPFNHSSVDKA